MLSQTELLPVGLVQSWPNAAQQILFLTIIVIFLINDRGFYYILKVKSSDGSLPSLAASSFETLIF